MNPAKIPHLRRASLVAATLTTSLSLAQTATWSSPTSGTWSNAANWSTNPTYPNSTGTSALISAAGSPYTITLNSAISLKSLTASSPDATLTITTAPTSLGTLALTGSTLNLNAPLPSTLAGHVTLSNSTLNLNTSLTAAQFAPFTAARTSTPINVAPTAAILNTGNTLPLDATTGPLNLLSSGTAGASITGGTLGTSPDALTNLFGSASLTAVTLNGTLSLASHAVATAHTSLTLNNAHISLNQGLTQFPGAITTFTADALAGAGTISFDGTLVGGIEETVTLPTLPAGITILTGTNSGGVTASTIAGTISAQTPNQVIALQPNVIIGTIQASNNSSVAINTLNAPFSDITSTHTLTAGAWVASNGTIAIRSGNGIVVTPPITTISAPASVTLAGTNSVFDSIKSLTTNAGSFSLAAGRHFVTPSADFSNAGTLTLTTAASFVAAKSLTNTGSISVDSSYLGTLTSLANAGSVTLGPSATLNVSATLTNTGQITLAAPTSALLLNYTTTSPIDDLRTQLLTHRITTPLPNTTIAYAEASQLPAATAQLLANNTTTDATTLILHTAPPGDANLDGSVTPDDYALLDRSYAQQPPNPHWTDGDFNYDGLINQQDYLLIDKTLLLQSPSPETLSLLSARESQFGPTYITTLLTSVPEPTSLLTFTLPLLQKRKRRS